MKKIILMLIIATIVGCSYSVYSSGYPHLKTIALPYFENATTEYELEESLQQNFVALFQKDGRLDIATLSPDCILEGKILDYSNKILTYDDTNVEGYQVKILFSITFTDMKKNEIIYQNPSLMLKETYSETDDSIEIKNEVDAQKEIFNDLFEEILSKSLEEW